MTREYLLQLQSQGQGIPEELIDGILEAHEKTVRQVRAEGLLEAAIAQARGRNPKAITALLDMESLLDAEDPKAAAELAVAELKKDCGYLFEQVQVPPPYAAGTGVQGQEPAGPVTLADALRERFGK